MLLQDIKIILCRPAESGNVGAVCRAMKNMGLSDLRLAAPGLLVQKEIYSRAVNAEDIWKNARTFDNLDSSIEDCSIVIGTTRRRGNYRKNISMTPRALAAWLAERPGPAAIVFGNERTGLEEAELNMCGAASHIPVSCVHPSLNLSHAVQVYAYEFFLAMAPQNPVKGEWTAMNQGEISALTGSITDTLKSFGFYKNPNREEQTRFLRDVISRAGLSDREGKYFRDIIIKAAKLGDS